MAAVQLASQRTLMVSKTPEAGLAPKARPGSCYVKPGQVATPVQLRQAQYKAVAMERKPAL